MLEFSLFRFVAQVRTSRFGATWTSKALTIAAQMSDHERREFQRLKLAKPLLASLDGHSALILDVGLTGAFLEHRGRAVPGLKVRVAFKFQGAEIAYRATVVRSAIIRDEAEEGPVSQSAVKFTEPSGDSEERLREMMAAFVAQLLDAHRANATAGDTRTASILTQLGEARRARSRGGLVTYRWDGTSWTHATTNSAKQPLDGFTVAAYEDEEELSTLCEAYEAADEEGRRLIRLVAELSVRSAAATK